MLFMCKWYDSLRGSLHDYFKFQYELFSWNYTLNYHGSLTDLDEWNLLRVETWWYNFKKQVHCRAKLLCMETTSFDLGIIIIRMTDWGSTINKQQVKNSTSEVFVDVKIAYCY